MLEKEISQLSDQSLLNLYKSIIPSTSLLETFSRKIESHGGDLLGQLKESPGNKNDSHYRTDKTILNYKRHVIEMKIFALKVLEEINQRGLETSDSYERINAEVNYIEDCSQFLDGNSGPTLTPVPQGAETLPYLNRGSKK